MANLGLSPKKFSLKIILHTILSLTVPKRSCQRWGLEVAFVGELEQIGRLAEFPQFVNFSESLPTQSILMI